MEPKMLWGFACCMICFLQVAVSAQRLQQPGTLFDYSGPKGPSHWADLMGEWKVCGSGHNQSPIDLTKNDTRIDHNLGLLKKSYHPSYASLKNRGHDVMVKWANGAGKIHVDGSNFTLLQCHWHSPSEHTINGKRYALEIHLVHQTQDNRTVVIGILYKYGRHDSFLAEITNQLMSLTHNMTPGAEKPLGIVDPKHIKLGSRQYFQYVGSLTTPPCTEGVIWIIVKKIRTVSREQVKRLVMAVHDGVGQNARPTQDRNGRIVEMYKTGRH